MCLGVITIEGEDLRSYASSPVEIIQARCCVSVPFLKLSSWPEAGSHESNKSGIRLLECIILASGSAGLDFIGPGSVIAGCRKSIKQPTGHVFETPVVNQRTLGCESDTVLIYLLGSQQLR